MRFDRRQNRFQGGSFGAASASGGASPSAPGGAPVLDVSGRVAYRGTAPVEVSIFGATFAFEGPIVRVGSTSYALVTLHGRECLLGVAT